MPENEGQADAGGGDDPAAGGTDEPVSDEEREALRAMRETGMGATELVSRARRDYQAEYAPEAGAAPAAGPGNTAGTEQTNEQGEVLLTRAEAAEMLQRGRQENRLEAMQSRQHQVLQDGIAEVIKAQVGELPDWKHANIEGEVARRLSKNVKVSGLGAREFAAEVARTTQAVIEDERKMAAELTSKDRDTELDTRLAAQRDAPDASSAGGSGKRSAKPSPPRAAGTERVHNPPFGMLSSRESWPSEDESANVNRDDLQAFERSSVAGRS